MELTGNEKKTQVKVPFWAVFYIFNYIFKLNTKIPRVMIYTSISIDFDLLNPMKPFI